jgi:uncharacterized phiE125 gp8 family phage protein
MRYTVKGGPTTYPVSEEELAAWLRIEGPCNDPKFLFALETATQAVISYSGRAMLEQEYSIQFDEYPGTGTKTLGLERLDLRPVEWIDLPYPPLISVDQVSTKDVDGNVTVIPSSEYRVDDFSEPGRLQFYGNPVNFRDLLTITYKAGYGSRDDVPFGMRQAVLTAAAYAYDHFGQCDAGSIIQESGAAALLIPYRMMRL